ncbi:TPA: hypothetical protein PC537_003672 [Morganella morganii]|nr:hypothetical protein [Morganella morganii]
MISKKEKIALLHMLAIKESLTKAEFNNVLNEVQKISLNSFFPKKLNEVNISISTEKKSGSPKQSVSFDHLLKKIKVSEPEKYDLLHQLRGNIRSGIVLKKFSDIKDLMAKLDQVGLIATSKAKTVDCLLVYLSKKKTDEIRSVIKNHIRPIETNNDKGFYDLANYIISPGKK